MKIYPVMPTEFLCYSPSTESLPYKIGKKKNKIGTALLVFGYTAEIFIFWETILKYVVRKISSELI